MAAAAEDISSLASQCLALCQALASQGQEFTFSVNIGSSFSFSLDSRGKVPEVKPLGKRSSPSTKRRNARRRQAFLKKKAEPPVSSLVSSSEFKCTQCDSLFKSGEELKIHIDDMHASSELKTPEKERSHPPTSDLSLSPVLGEGREEPPSSQLVDPPSSSSLEKFKCDICGETFIGKTLKSALRFHKLMAHNQSFDIYEANYVS